MKTKNILTEQSKHSITDCLKELKFSRPAKAQELIDKLIEISESEHEYYPSRYKVGEIIKFTLTEGSALIEAVKFTRNGKVLYDLGIRMPAENGYGTILKEIDSLLIEKI